MYNPWTRRNYEELKKRQLGYSNFTQMSGGRHQLLHGAVCGGLVNEWIRASRRNRAHQYRHTVVCSYDKHHRPWENIG